MIAEAEQGKVARVTRASKRMAASLADEVGAVVICASGRVELEAAAAELNASKAGTDRGCGGRPPKVEDCAPIVEETVGRFGKLEVQKK